MRAILVVGIAMACFAAYADKPHYASVKIDGVPFVRQRPDFCGEACVQMWMNKLGKRADQNYVFNISGLDPALGQGCDTPDLSRALTAIGFHIGPVAYNIRTDHKQEDLDAAFGAMHADLLAGIPSIVEMYYSKPGVGEHYRLVVGYDAQRDEVLYMEPSEAGGGYRHISRERFFKLSALEAPEDFPTYPIVFARFRLDGDPQKLVDEPPESATGRQHPKSAADFAQHVLRLKQKTPRAAWFTIVIEPPFVVVGDEEPETVKSRAEQTVKWAVDHLKRTYFPRDPDRILDIWLFKNKESYESNVKSIFGDTPTTPYGYYSAAHGALIMNIATGGGKLVHEIVHPFMAANFAKCPAWFNEGLASLYEQCGEENGHIHGYPNWRLPALQQAIRAGAVPSFEKLCGTTTEQFYGEDRGTNYGQARYLCYYLQERGLLEKYYRQFHAHAADDPTGYKTLQTVLGESDMAAFQKRWQDFVMGLKFE